MKHHQAWDLYKTLEKSFRVVLSSCMMLHKVCCRMCLACLGCLSLLRSHVSRRDAPQTLVFQILMCCEMVEASDTTMHQWSSAFAIQQVNSCRLHCWP